MWVVLGLILAAIELATPGGFFVIFFGVGAVAVGLLERAGAASQPWVQWLLFPVIAVIALRLFRKPLLARLNAGEPKNVDALVGEVAVPEGDIAAGQYGRAQFRGSSWSAHNVADEPISAGQRCRVIAVQGLMLDLRPE